MERALTRTALTTLGVALLLAVILEFVLLVPNPATEACVMVARVFVLGATSALLAHVDLADRGTIQSRPLLLSVLLTLFAALIDVGYDALALAVDFSLPMPVDLLAAVTLRFTPLLALTMLTLSFIEWSARGITLIVLSSTLAFVGAALAFAGLGEGADHGSLTIAETLVRASSTLIALIALFGSAGSAAPPWRIPRFSIFETMAQPRRADLRPPQAAMALAPEPQWRMALQGANLLRAAELTRLLVMLLVLLLGFALMPMGETAIIPLILAQDLALLFIALTTLMGLSRFARVPFASGARGPALAALSLATLTLIHVLGTLLLDLALLTGRGSFPLSMSLDTAARFSTLGTIVAVCIAIGAIARRTVRRKLERSVRLAGELYFGATVALTVADQIGPEDPVFAMVLKLMALLLFAAGFTRLVRALGEVAPLIEAERRKALGQEFA